MEEQRCEKCKRKLLGDEKELCDPCRETPGMVLKSLMTEGKQEIHYRPVRLPLGAAGATGVPGSGGNPLF